MITWCDFYHVNETEFCVNKLLQNKLMIMACASLGGSQD